MRVRRVGRWRRGGGLLRRQGAGTQRPRQALQPLRRIGACRVRVETQGDQLADGRTTRVAQRRGHRLPHRALVQQRRGRRGARLCQWSQRGQLRRLNGHAKGAPARRRTRARRQPQRRRFQARQLGRQLGDVIERCIADGGRRRRG